MYYINKIVGWVLSPIGMLFLGLGFSWLMHRKHPKFARWFCVFTLGLMWVFSCGITTRLIGLPLEGEETYADLSDIKSIDAIVLLGGGMGYHEQCGRFEMFSGADRVWEAARMWRLCQWRPVDSEECAPRVVPIIMSGGGVEQSTVPILVNLGIYEDLLMTFPEARNTEEEAKLIAAAFEKERPKIIMVTSAWHMPRAKALFERAGLEVVPAPTDYEMHCIAEHPLEFGDFLPNSDALLRNSWAVKEWVARFGYWVKGMR